MATTTNALSGGRGGVAVPDRVARADRRAATVRRHVLEALQRVAPERSGAALDPATPLREQVDLDSMDWLNFFVALSERLGADIPEVDQAKLATIDDVVAYLARRRPASSEHASPLTGDHRLADGRTVTVRRMTPDDADHVREFLAATSEESRYKRFQRWITAPSNEIARSLTDIDDRRGPALVATVATASGEEIIAEARCVAHPGGRSCDLGLLVEDAWQKTGVAGLLMEALIEAARDQGFATIEGFVLKSNAPMLQFAHAFGFEIEPVEGDRTTLCIRRLLQVSPTPVPMTSPPRPADEPPAKPARGTELDAPADAARSPCSAAELEGDWTHGC